MAQQPPRGRMRVISVEDGRDRREGPLRGWKDSNRACLLSPLQAWIIGGDTLSMLKPIDRMLKDALGLPGFDFIGFVLPLRNARAAGLFAVGFRIVALALLPLRQWSIEIVRLQDTAGVWGDHEIPAEKSEGGRMMRFHFHHR
jgi:hypothetical protein